MSDTQRDREERQHVIEVLKQMRLDYEDFWEENDTEEIKAFNYAIASIETDLKYDLLYEETSGQADKPTTKNDLGVDLIPRAEVLKLMQDNWHTHNGDWAMQESMDDIRALPAVTPQEPRWIPVSEKLPNDRNWYLGIFKESDTGWINPLPFICDYVGRKTKATTKEFWILRGFTDMDEHIDYYYNLECVAWMPLPESYEAESENKENGQETSNS